MSTLAPLGDDRPETFIASQSSAHGLRVASQPQTPVVWRTPKAKAAWEKVCEEKLGGEEEQRSCDSPPWRGAVRASLL
jgi:hypothetical protein